MNFLRSLFFSLGIALGSVVFTLIAIEGCYRLGMMLSSPAATWSDRPAAYYNPAEAISLQGNLYEVPKPTDTFRIAVLGDSFSFAPYMQFDDAFPARLQRMLNLQEKKEIEVINYGVPGYSTSHESEEAKRAIAEEADLLLLQITLNDPQRKSYRPTGLTGINDFGAYEPPEKLTPLLRYWKSLGYGLQRIHNTKTHQRYIDYYFSLFEKEKNWDHFQGALKRLRKVARRKNVPVVAVVFPLFGLPVNDAYPFVPIHTKITDELTALEIPYLDLLSDFSEIPLERIQVIPGTDFHPNEIGHRIASESIYRWLQTLNVLPEEVFAIPQYRNRTDIRLLADNMIKP